LRGGASTRATRYAVPHVGHWKLAAVSIMARQPAARFVFNAEGDVPLKEHPDQELEHRAIKL